MLDRQMLALVRPLIDRIATIAHVYGFTANQISLFGFAAGVLAAVMIAAGIAELAVIPLIINRICDGLDGALARRQGPTDRGAFLDITLDFLFYASIPLAFAFANPSANALPAAVLLAAFIGTGTSFLAFAILAEKRSERSTDYPSKAFYYLGGLAEGSETIFCFVLMCLLQDWFPPLAYLYSILCTITTATRLGAGWQRFR
jgi:phosphatidylglycerophosphate synthase